METSFKAVIIDDEADGRNIISLLLTANFPGIRIAGQAEDVRSGIELIENTRPDMIFLDIEMPDGNAFDLISGCPDRIDNVILVTGYDHYAIKAIKSSVIDYLLKPVDKKEFVAAVEKAIGRKKKEQYAMSSIPALLEEVRKSGIRKTRIPTLQGFILVNVDDILRCEASGNYTIIHFTDQKQLIASRTLGEYEEELKSFGFVRLHHKHVVNINQIKEYNKGKNGGGYIILHGSGEMLEVSARKKAQLLNMLGRYI